MTDEESFSVVIVIDKFLEDELAYLRHDEKVEMLGVQNDGHFGQVIRGDLSARYPQATERLRKYKVVLLTLDDFPAEH